MEKTTLRYLICLSEVFKVCVCVYVNEVALSSAFEALSSRCLEKCKYESVLRSSQRERILFDALSHREGLRRKLKY